MTADSPGRLLTKEERDAIARHDEAGRLVFDGRDVRAGADKGWPTDLRLRLETILSSHDLADAALASKDARIAELVRSEEAWREQALHWERVAGTREIERQRIDMACTTLEERIFDLETQLARQDITKMAPMSRQDIRPACTVYNRPCVRQDGCGLNNCERRNSVASADEP